jgi:hypothetical protein
MNVRQIRNLRVNPLRVLSTVAGEITRGTAPVWRWNRNGIGSLIRRSWLSQCWISEVISPRFGD